MLIYVYVDTIVHFWLLFMYERRPTDITLVVAVTEIHASDTFITHYITSSTPVAK